MLEELIILFFFVCILQDRGTGENGSDGSGRRRRCGFVRQVRGKKADKSTVGLSCAAYVKTSFFFLLS